MDRVFALGRYLYGMAVAASGIRQLVRLEFVRLVPGFPAWIPGHVFWACLTGVILTLAGAAILTDRWLRPGALVAGTLLLLLFLLFYVPQIAGNPLTGYIWTNPCKTLALLGGPILLVGNWCVAAAGVGAASARWAAGVRPLSWIFLGVFLAICGVQHFVYATFVDTLVPAWIPPTQRFWTFFAGACLVAGGVGLALPKTARLAAAMSGLMVFLWVLLLHIPRAVGMKSAFELDGVFEATAVAGVCLLVARAAPTTAALRAKRRQDTVEDSSL